MNTHAAASPAEDELPADVLALIRADRKIEAIKLLRHRQRIGLKEAKDLVDAASEKLPRPTQTGKARSESGLGRFVAVLLLVAAAYCAYLLIK